MFDDRTIAAAGAEQPATTPHARKYPRIVTGVGL